jgi:hypothetical protein
MVVSFITRVLNFMRQKHVQVILDVLRILSAASFLITVFGLFFFTLGYSFLYGYFLSGDSPEHLSILSIVTNPIPFNYYTVLITSTLLILSVIFVMSATYVVKNGVIHAKLSVTIFFLIFHVCLSIFFVNGSDLFDKIISFSVIWIVPLFISIMMYWTIRSPLRVALSFSGTLYGFYTILIFSQVFNWIDSVIQLVIPTGSFLLGILFTLMKKSWYKYYFFRFLLILPYTLSSLVLLGTLVNYFYKLLQVNIIWFVIIAIVVTLIVSLRKIKIKEDKIQEENMPTLEFNLRLLEQAGKASILTTFCIVVVVLGIFAPNLSLIGGQYIREFTTDGVRELQVINDYDKGVTIKGNLISIREGNYYISNEKWKLEIIKGDKIYVKSNQEDR